MVALAQSFNPTQSPAQLFRSGSTWATNAFVAPQRHGAGYCACCGDSTRFGSAKKAEAPRFGCGPAGEAPVRADNDSTVYSTHEKLQRTTVNFSDPKLGILTKIALAPIWAYHMLTRKKEGDNKVGRTWLGSIISSKCPYDPTCSEYAQQCIIKYGPVKGWAFGLYRAIVKCNPLYLWATGKVFEPRANADPA